MNKALLSLPVFVMLVVSAVALQISLRADNGTVNYIASDTVFSFTDSHFNGWAQDAQGRSSVIIRARTLSGVPLNIGGTYKQVAILQNDAATLKVSASGTAVYWKKGSLPSRAASSIVYELDKATNKLTVTSTSGVAFKVSNMDAITVA